MAKNRDKAFENSGYDLITAEKIARPIVYIYYIYIA